MSMKKRDLKDGLWHLLNNLFVPVRQVFQLLDPTQKRKTFWCIWMILGNAVLDIFTISAILPIIFLAANPAHIKENLYLSSLYSFLGFSSEGLFSLFLIFALLTLFVIKNLVSAIISWYQINFVYNVASNLGRKSFNDLYQKSYLDFISADSGKLSKKIYEIPMVFAQHILLPLLYISSELLVFFLICIGILIFDWKILVLMLVVFVPGLVGLYLLKKKHLATLNQEISDAYANILKRILQSIDSFTETMIYQKQNFFINRFLDAYRKQNKALGEVQLINTIPIKIIEVVAFLGIAIIFGYYFFYLEDREHLIITLGLFTAAAYRMMPSFNRIMINAISFKTHQYALREVISMKSQNFPSKGIALNDFKKTIQFKKVTFGYPKSKSRILNQLDLSIRKGELIGLTGPSGQGKSTVAKLLTGLIQPDEGDIYIDGKSLSEINLSSWHKLVAYVPQTPCILDASIAENIAFGEYEQNIDHGRIHKIIELVKLGDLVGRLEDGLATNVCEKGAKISGGEVKRLVLARALYRDPKVLILDELTSELDKNLEEEIFRLIKSLVDENKTVLVISHQTIIHHYCDKVYNMENNYLVPMEKEADINY